VEKERHDTKFTVICELCPAIIGLNTWYGGALSRKLLHEQTTKHPAKKIHILYPRKYLGTH